MKILFSGGGTLGPVTPLLAIKDIVADTHPNAQFLWVGTPLGPEKELVEKQGIPFVSIRSGKLRRYMSLLNIVDIANMWVGAVQSVGLLLKHRPDVCISAGGFVSVPVHIAAWLLGMPTWVHQQDIRPGLANKIMAPLATRMTTALKSSLQYFPKQKTMWIGNPVRQEVLTGSADRARELFHIPAGADIVFVTGGGTGSFRVNQMVAEALPHLHAHIHVIHLSGKERPQELSVRMEKEFPAYHHRAFLTHEMKDAYAAAAVVISRGGFGTITELAALAKPSVLIPKPGHQEDNVAYLSDAQAVVVMNELLDTGNALAHTINDLLADEKKRTDLGKRLHEVLPIATPVSIMQQIELLLHR